MAFRNAVTVAFDWNGTLVDDAARACAAVGVVLERRGRSPLSLAGFHEGFCLPLRTWFTRLGVPEEDLERAIWEWNAEMADRPAELAEGAREALAGMRSAGVHLGVVSAAGLDALHRDLARPALKGFAEQLTFVVGDADPKREALARLATGGEGIVFYVGDTEYDMVEARAAGVRAIGYAGGYRPADALASAGAERIIGLLSELPDLLVALRSDALSVGSDGLR